MLSSLITDQHVNSVAGAPRNLVRSDHAFTATSDIYSLSDSNLCDFASGFMLAASNFECPVGDVVPSCCSVNDNQSREQLEKAIRFFFQEDYFMATENMILWWRKAVDDLAMCEAD